MVLAFPSTLDYPWLKCFAMSFAKVAILPCVPKYKMKYGSNKTKT